MSNRLRKNKKAHLITERQLYETIKQHRIQISEDIHDEIAGKISVLKYFVSSLKLRSNNPELISVTTEIELAISRLYQDTKEFMNKLSGPNDTELSWNFYDALYPLIGEYNAQIAIRIETPEQQTINKSLNSFQKGQLLKVIKESVVNVIKHALASSIKISVQVNEKDCVFEICDDGVGFDKSLSPSGLGLKSLKRRIGALGGLVELQSTHQGTKISGKFPIDQL